MIFRNQGKNFAGDKIPKCLHGFEKSNNKIPECTDKKLQLHQSANPLENNQKYDKADLNNIIF